MTISPNRLVAIATPLLFAPLAGAITAWTAKHAPGVDIDAGQLQAIFIAGATIAFAKAGLWMKGWQDYEKRQEATPVDALEIANEMALADVDDMGFTDDEAGIEGGFDLAVGDPDLDDDMEDEDLDNEIAEFEPAMGDEADAMPVRRT
jgi:hypothetical protein